MADALELSELLDDLGHDLGKYLVLPLAMLPDGADQASLREALSRALLETHGGLGAQQLWEAFLRDAGDALDRVPGGADQLRGAVARALSWRTALDAGAPLPRSEVMADLRSVRTAIAALQAALAEPGSHP